MVSSYSLNERMSRYDDLVPRDALLSRPVTVLGCGAIGRQVSIQLASMGVPHLRLIDHDTVDAVNLGSQGWLECDVGHPKVIRLGGMLRLLNSSIQLDLLPERYNARQPLGNTLFCCVDDMDIRQLAFARFWHSLRSSACLFIDGRMLGEVMRVLTVKDTSSAEHYEKQLFDNDQAHPGRCSTKSTIYCSNVAAGLMVGQYAKWLRGVPVEEDVMFNLIGMAVSNLGKDL